MQARYYDPVIGRFYSNDPVATNGQLSHGDRVHGFNRCKYANNNPYKFVDPNGQDSVIGTLTSHINRRFFAVITMVSAQFYVVQPLFR